MAQPAPTTAPPKTSAPMLSQTNVKTINQRCLELVRKLACIEAVRKECCDPILTWSAKERDPPVALEDDPVGLCWSILRQGGALCYLLNKLRANTIDSIKAIDEPLSADFFLRNKSSRENMMTFLKACKEELYMTDDQLFMPSDLYTTNTNALTKAVDIAEKFMKKIYDTQRFNWDKKAVALVDSSPELYGASVLDVAEASASAAAAGKAANGEGRDKRLLVIDEMLDTERKYVADLELLHHFAEECKMDNVVDAEAYYAIFSNLDKLLDFQRKFLILIETPLSQAQRSLEASYKANIGQLFVEQERNFAVYDTFCANHKRASEMASLEAANLQQKARIMDPKAQLPSFLIKPVQRICKYPLLLRELVKMSPADAPDMADLKAAEAAMKRVGDRVNEKQRCEENAIVAAEFKERVDDWKGVKREEDLGDLQLHEPHLLITQTANEKSVEKELMVFLFANIIVMAKEGKGSSTISMFKKKMTATPLTIKGYIYMKQVAVVEPVDDTTIRVAYREDPHTTVTFTMHFRNAEMAGKWRHAVEKEARRFGSLVGAGAAVGVGAAVGAGVITGVKPGESVAVDKAARRKSRVILAAERVAIPSHHNPLQPTTTHQPLNQVAPEMRVKVEYKEDVYMLVVLDIPSLKDLRKLALAKIHQDYDMTGRQCDLVEGKMRLRYKDGEDRVVLVDEGDLAEAVELHTNELKVYVSCL